MIDFHLRAFIDALADLNIAQTRAHMGGDRDQFVDLGEKELIRINLTPIERECVQLRMPTVINRLSRVATMLSPDGSCTHGMLSHEVDEIFNAVERDAREEFFCHYDRDRLAFLLRMRDEWAGAFAAFKSAKAEIEEGIDCYALGHNLACVFHMCRAAEIGLRTIARERRVKNARKNVPIEWGTWGQVFAAIEAQLKTIRSKSPGSRKDAALAFYDTILSDLHAIQSLYRDRTMHLRKNYDDGEAQSAIFRVRELMTTLSSKLSENSTRAIPWSAWR